MKAMKKILIGSIVLVLIVVAGAGCLKKAQQKPLPRPQAEALKPEPKITLFINQTGQKKQIAIEEYLAGVVAAEMDTAWPVESLAAQVILARTFTLENINAGRIKKLHGTDASTSVEEFQAYAPEKINDNVRKAVAMTRGEVVLYQNKYIHAWFHACDGGKSATAKEGLAYTKEPTPYVKVVNCPCMKITVPENQAWTAKFSKEQVTQAVLKSTGQKVGPITTASIAQKGPSGRTEKIKIGTTVVGGPALRLALGSSVLRSMKLDNLNVQGNMVIFQGKGFGHGVGLCQWGAKQQAGTGKSPQEIIKFYFKNINIEKKWK